MIKIIKTTVAFIIAFCVLMGQSGMLLAVDSVSVPSKCTKCPCEIEKPSCCVKRSNSTETPDSPAVPAPEQRVLQPVSFEPVEVGIVNSIVPKDTTSFRFDVALSASSEVPLFLRHRAILI